MSPYVYKGSNHNVDEPVKQRRAGRMDGFDPSACGTYAGYRRHQKHGVPACKGCKDAQAAYSRDRYHATGGTYNVGGFNIARCGTYSGYRQHRTHGQEACPACKAANAAYIAKYRAKKVPA